MFEDFNIQAHKHWNAGHQSKAIECVVNAINNYHTPHKPKGLLTQFAYYLFFIKDYKAANHILKEAIQYYPEDPELKINLVVSLSRCKEYEKAINEGKSLIENNINQFTVWDVLANCYAKTQQWDLAVMAGNKALKLKDAQYSQSTPNWKLPKQSIKEHIDNKKHVIAFSLWGNQERYINGAIRNLLLRHDFYPNWEIWIYLDQSVPQSICDKLTQLGAVLKYQSTQQTNQQKLCWRFKVVNHKDVGRFLVRDIDSVFSMRERLTVEEWLQSDKWFHTIHDWWTHTDLILAGLWGGVANVLPNVWDMVEAYQPTSLTTPNVDQWFLRDCLWSYIKQSCLMHDRLFRQEQAQPIPGPEPVGNQHIGSCEFSQMPDCQRQLISAWLK